MDPLADLDDVESRGVTIPDGVDGVGLLDAASSAVREAAGCPISQVTSTVDLTLDDYTWIDLPGGPVTAVASLSIEGVSIATSTLTAGRWSAGWRKVGDALLLNCVPFCLPATATVTYTHGFAFIPADIVDLVCGMVSIAANQGADYGSVGRETSVRLGDFSESQKVPAGAESPSPLALPDSVRQRLRARFGTSVAVVGVRR